MNEKTHDLLSALDNESNESIMKLNNRKIKDIKNTILQRLQLDRGSIEKIYIKN